MFQFPTVKPLGSRPLRLACNLQVDDRSEFRQLRLDPLPKPMAAAENAPAASTAPTKRGTTRSAQRPERQPRSLLQFPTVKPPSVLDACGSRTTSRSMISPSFVNSVSIRSNS
jgi:hypothetical protein